MGVLGYLEMHSPCIDPREAMFQVSSKQHDIWAVTLGQRTVGKWIMVMYPLGNVPNMIPGGVVGGFGYLKMHNPCIDPREAIFQVSSKVDNIWAVTLGQRAVGKWIMVTHPLGNVPNMIPGGMVGGFGVFRDAQPLHRP